MIGKAILCRWALNALKHPSTLQLLAMLCLSLLVLPLFGQNLDAAGLETALDKLMGSELVKGASIGVAFYATADSTLIYGHRENAKLIPASLQKIYTGIGALEALGVEHRHQTVVGVRGQIADGVLQGDLVVKGGGDPSWMEDFYPDGPHRVFELWADMLQARGIRKVNGDLIGDISLYPTYPYNPLWEKVNLPYGYSPSIAALSFNANLVRFDLQGATQTGSKARAWPRHGYDYFSFSNQISTVAKKGSAALWLQVSPDNRKVTLQGKLGVDTPEYLTAAVRNPPLFTLQVMKESLRNKGISISGKTVVNPDPEPINGFRTLFEFASPSLGEILAVMLKTSSNMIAETLLCNIGASPDSGAAFIEKHLEELGFPAASFHIADGSGLARQNSFTASHLGLTLCHARQQQWFEVFLNSLAFPGEPGTLRKRFKELEGRSQLYGKTGTLRDVSNLAGYLRAADGELYAFVIVCNDVGSIAKAKKWQDQVCETLLRYSRLE